MAPLIAAVATKVGAVLATKVGTATVGGILATTAGAVGTGLTVAGQLQAGQQASDQAGIEAGLADTQAAQEEAATADETLRRRRAAADLASAQRNRFAGQGIDISTGTPLLVVAETLLDAQEDVDAIQQTGQGKARTFKSKAQTFRDFGSATLATSRLQAGGSLLTGLSNLTT